MWFFFHLPVSSVSGSQDIRNIIPFSGNGFVLGGRSQANKPVGKASPAGVRSSPNFPTVSQIRTPSSLPVLSALNDRNIPNAHPPKRPPSLAGPNAPIKRSVSNTKVFVSINGSPVRIHKTHSGSGSHEVKKIKQRSIDDLMNAANSRKPTGPPSASNREKDCGTSAPSLFSPTQNNSAAQPGPSAKGSPAKATQPNANNASQASRKRPLDGGRGSTTIYDFFQRTSGGISTGAESPSAAQPSPSSSSSSPSSSLTSFFPGPAPSSSTSSASFAVMVNCPVCQAKVQESKINEHLDSCLS